MTDYCCDADDLLRSRQATAHVATAQLQLCRRSSGEGELRACCLLYEASKLIVRVLVAALCAVTEHGGARWRVIPAVCSACMGSGRKLRRHGANEGTTLRSFRRANEQVHTIACALLTNGRIWQVQWISKDMPDGSVTRPRRFRSHKA